MTMWRLGSKDPKIVRLQSDPEPDTRPVTEGGDPSIGFFVDSAFAAEAVAAVNLVRRFELCVECGTQGDRCRAGWPQRECCPSCTHREGIR